MRSLPELIVVAVLLGACGSEPPRTRVLEGEAPAAGPPMDELPTPASRCPDGVTTADIAACMRDEAAAADRMLAALTDSIARTASPAVAARMAEASGHWERYRTAECDAAGLFHEGGSMQPVAVFGCRAALAEARASAIRGQLPPR